MKPKRTPQRGLGVAQLERIRLEEQHTVKDKILHSATSVLAPPSKISSKNRDFRPKNSSATTFLDGFHPKPPKKLNGCSELWTGEYSSPEDHGGGFFQPSLELPHEPQIPILPLPSVLHRSQQYQQPPCSSPMVSVSSGMSLSSLTNLQMEPPSNQSYYIPLWPEEVKMIGLKRPYPFTPEYPPIPEFNCKYPPSYVAPLSKPHDSVSEAVPLLKREVPLQTRTLYEDKPRNVFREDTLNGDFLTLAPPTAVGAGNHQVSSYSTPKNGELFKFKSVPFREVAQEAITSSGLNRSVHQPMYRFFPPANVQTGRAGTYGSNCHGEVGGKVDLSLKL